MSTRARAAASKARHARGAQRRACYSRSAPRPTVAARQGTAGRRKFAARAPPSWSRRTRGSAGARRARACAPRRVYRGGGRARAEAARAVGAAVAGEGRSSSGARASRGGEDAAPGQGGGAAHPDGRTAAATLERWRRFVPAGRPHTCHRAGHVRAAAHARRRPEKSSRARGASPCEWQALRTTDAPP